MATEKKSKETSGLKKTKEGSAHKKKEYKVSARLQEGKKVLYGIVFNLLDSRYKDLFATCGGNRATVYRCLEDGSVSGLHTYVDENKEESFYTVAWMVGEKGVPLLAASGSTGVIRILDCFHEKVLHSFIGHGGSVNELRAHPLLPHLLISASKDESVRLWNVATGVCVLIFAGAGGHRNEVLSVDFHPADKTLIASCGMDSSVRVWSLKEFWHVVERSDRWTGLRSAFPTKMVQYPVSVHEHRRRAHQLHRPRALAGGPHPLQERGQRDGALEAVQQDARRLRCKGGRASPASLPLALPLALPLLLPTSACPVVILPSMYVFFLPLCFSRRAVFSKHALTCLMSPATSVAIWVHRQRRTRLDRSGPSNYDSC